MPDHPRHALPIGHRIAGYRIVRMIGQGGFGIVYEATNPVTQERVAVKEFYPSSMASRQEGTIVLNNVREAEVYSSVLGRFEQTAGTQFQFKHPNILEVYNYIPGENTGYMITEFIEGESLRGFLQKYGGHFPSAEMFHATMEQVVGAIGYVHRLGHIHRDLAPDNVMVDPFEKPTVIDFGALKRDLRSSNAYSSIVVMREDYSPPEQQDPSLQQDFYTDVFALAGTMYCALSGGPPFRATSRILSPDGDPYISIARASKIPCPPEVFNAIDAGLRLPTRDRPQSCEEFAAMLGWQPFFGDGMQPADARRRDRGATNVVTRQVSPGSNGRGGQSAGAGQPPPPQSPSQPSLPPPGGAGYQQPQLSPAPRRAKSPAPAIIGIAVAVVAATGGLWALSQRRDPTSLQGQPPSSPPSTPTKTQPPPTPPPAPPPSTTPKPPTTTIPELPTTPPPTPPPQQTLCPSGKANPIATVELRERFKPDPYRRQVSAGGTADLSKCEVGSQPLGTGWVSVEMDIRLTYRSSGNARLTITIESNFDSVLVVLDADGRWHYNDDGIGTNGRLVFERAKDGLYDIWVGTFSNTALQKATVAISNR